MSSSTAIWELPDFYHLDNGFFRPQEKKQIQTAYENYIKNTKSLQISIDEQLDETDNSQMLLQSKLQLFQLFVRTQPVNIRSFSVFHQEKQRVFVERLFYLFLNNVALTHFSTYSVDSIIQISKELEKYQRATNKTILNTGKLNTVIQFVLSFSSSSISSFQLNNLFYLLLNDMNDFSGKVIDRIAELLRTYHGMTYGHAISKQYLITTVDHAISTINFINPRIYPLYENFLNSSYVYKGPLTLVSNKSKSSISLMTIIQNLSLALLGLTEDDFDCEENFLSLTSEQCYQIRLTIRRLSYIFKHHHYSLDFPLRNLDKQIVIYLIHSIILQHRTFDTLKTLLDLYMMNVRGFSQTKIKQLLFELLSCSAFEKFVIETIGRFIEINRFEAKILLTDSKIAEDDLWLNDEQIRLLTHLLYSEEIYAQVFLPIIDGDAREQRTITDILTYLDRQLEHRNQSVIDVQKMKLHLTIMP